MNTNARTLFLLAPLAALFVGLPAFAQYKVVTPDGHVTYTDTQPPNSAGTKVTKLGESQNSTPQVALPLELRQAVTRYPVTLYTLKVCEPCDSARGFLRQRGIPFAEKTVVTAEDGETLQRISGGRDAPTLTIGAQVLRGLSTDSWGSYLDSAGYPRESRLPANYQYPAATPLTDPPVVASERKAVPSQPAATPPAEQATPGGIRF